MTDKTITTEAGKNASNILPFTYFIRIGRIPTNNEESNSPRIQEELFCTLNDLDMLIAQQNPVMGELLEDSYFSQELEDARNHYVKQTFGGN